MVYVNEHTSNSPVFGAGDGGSYATPTAIADASAQKKQFPRPFGEQTIPWEQPIFDEERDINKDANGVQRVLAGVEYEDGTLNLKVQDGNFPLFSFMAEKSHIGSVDLSASGHDCSVNNHKFKIDGVEITLNGTPEAETTLDKLVTAINTQLLAAGIYHVRAYVDSAKYVALIGRAFVIAAGSSVDFLSVVGWTAASYAGVVTTMGSSLPSIAINWKDADQAYESYGCFAKESTLSFAKGDKYVKQELTLGHYKTDSSSTPVEQTLRTAFMSSTLANPLRLGQVTITVNGHAFQVTDFSLKIKNNTDDDFELNNVYRHNNNLKTREVEFELGFKDSTTTTPNVLMQAVRSSTLASRTMPIVITMAFTGRSATLTRTITLTNAYLEKMDGPKEIPEEAGFREFKCYFKMGESFTIVGA